jgi:hypothetical protein
MLPIVSDCAIDCAGEIRAALGRDRLSNAKRPLVVDPIDSEGEVINDCDAVLSELGGGSRGSAAAEMRSSS